MFGSSPVVTGLRNVIALATSRRKIEISGIVIDGRAERKARRGDRRACLNSDCGCGG
jgi:hypothetical protein